MFAGFKKFIMRGNVMELAVAVIIGSAFTAIVTAFTEGIIEPLLASIGGSPDIGLGFHIRQGQDATFVDIGSVLTGGSGRAPSAWRRTRRRPPGPRRRR